MRTMLIAAGALALSGCTASGEMTLAQEQEVQLAIQTATDSLFARAERTDTDAVFGMYNTDALHADDGRMLSVADMRSMYGPLYDRFDSIDFTVSRSSVEVFGHDVGLWTGEGTARGMEADTVGLAVSAAWTIVWERTDGGWQVHHIHGSTPAPDM